MFKRAPLSHTAELILFVSTQAVERVSDLLDGELRVTHRNAVHELQRWPQSVKFCAFVNVEDAISRWRANPNGVIQEAAQST